MPPRLMIVLSVRCPDCGHGRSEDVGDGAVAGLDAAYRQDAPLVVAQLEVEMPQELHGGQLIRGVDAQVGVGRSAEPWVGIGLGAADFHAARRPETIVRSRRGDGGEIDVAVPYESRPDLRAHRQARDLHGALARLPPLDETRSAGPSVRSPRALEALRLRPPATPGCPYACAQSGEQRRHEGRVDARGRHQKAALVRMRRPAAGSATAISLTTGAATKIGGAIGRGP